jgi:hypothetical protein
MSKLKNLRASDKETCNEVIRDELEQAGIVACSAEFRQTCFFHAEKIFSLGIMTSNSKS